VLDILVQSRRNAKAAKRFFTKLLKGLRHVPRAIVTDKLKSYGAAKREILPDTSRRDGENGRCSASSRHGMPSGFSPATARSTIPSSSGATASPPMIIGPPVTAPSRSGVRSPALLSPLDQRCCSRSGKLSSRPSS
jgi:hypothetical protein